MIKFPLKQYRFFSLSGILFILSLFACQKKINAACIAPTVAASGLTFSHVGCNSVQLHWTSGNGNKRIVVVYSNSTITTPTSGTGYTHSFNYGTGSALGSGRVVYDSTGTYVTVLGLSASTTYWFAVFEYNTVGPYCYLTASYPSSSKATTACTYCPYMSVALTDGCNTTAGCSEGDSEWLFFNTESYGWDNAADPPTVDYGSVSTGGTHNTSSYTVDGGSPGVTASINTAAGCTLLIDASGGNVAIPAWSTVLFCAVGTAPAAWCDNGYTWTGLCAYAPVYVIYGTNGLTSAGNYLDHSSTSPDIRYFDISFPISSCNAGSPEYYQYDAHLEYNGDGAYETYTQAGLSSNSGAPEDVTTYSHSCAFGAASALPIKLLSFTAKPDNNIVNIVWQTATETNNKLFTIEKSVNGLNWATVTTIAGAGNSNHPISYTAVDESPYLNISYYRIMQTDFDGQASYSGIIQVSIDPLANIIKLIPNPATNITSVSFNSIAGGSAFITVYDLAGRQIESKPLDVAKGNNIASLNVANYSNGLYFVTISTSMQQLSSKLVVNHN